jgi:hypothetical protein
VRPLIIDGPIHTAWDLGPWFQLFAFQIGAMSYDEFDKRIDPVKFVTNIETIEPFPICTSFARILKEFLLIVARTR